MLSLIFLCSFVFFDHSDHLQKPTLKTLYAYFCLVKKMIYSAHYEKLNKKRFHMQYNNMIHNRLYQVLRSFNFLKTLFDYNSTKVNFSSFCLTKSGVKSNKNNQSINVTFVKSTSVECVSSSCVSSPLQKMQLKLFLKQWHNVQKNYKSESFWKFQQLRLN